MKTHVIVSFAASLMLGGCALPSLPKPKIKPFGVPQAQAVQPAQYVQTPYGPRLMRASQPVQPAGFFQPWVESRADYTFYPGDQVDIVVSSAPELSRTLTVGPDGRIVMPMAGSVMAAGRTFDQVRIGLERGLATQLRDPGVALSPRAYAPEQIYVGGQVGQAGTYTLPGPIGALEALMMAGGMQVGAQTREIVVLRRAPTGGMMLRTVNLRRGLADIRQYDDNIPLRRGDIVFVPRTNLSEVGAFVQQVRGALPVDFNLSYQFGTNNGGTTVISP